MWYVQVEELETGLLVGKPVLWDTYEEACSAIHELERDFPNRDTREVVCWKRQPGTIVHLPS